ncbi:hypothetical protein N24_2880 [Corynebacterium suranareeae]|uniref:Uncharacterized protein n=1 Tax=Corynebacterium suranareeae TaxID=2506452 RepID=A0A161JPG2_9CORY|nr:hypothetical protein [Corynebacterium suranareeae]BAU97142.1 hypothetical protein N24_2880 [Corynebacterium suranareeae]
MHLRTDLPGHLVHHNIDYPSPVIKCRPSHTAAALSSADQHWRLLLFDANLHLHHHLSDMRTVSEKMLDIDQELSRSLERIL